MSSDFYELTTNHDIKRYRGRDLTPAEENLSQEIRKMIINSERGKLCMYEMIDIMKENGYNNITAKELFKPLRWMQSYNWIKEDYEHCFHINE